MVWQNASATTRATSSSLCRDQDSSSSVRTVRGALAAAAEGREVVLAHQGRGRGLHRRRGPAAGSAPARRGGATGPGRTARRRPGRRTAATSARTGRRSPAPRRRRPGRRCRRATPRRGAARGRGRRRRTPCGARRGGRPGRGRAPPRRCARRRSPARAAAAGSVARAPSTSPCTVRRPGCTAQPANSVPVVGQVEPQTDEPAVPRGGDGGLGHGAGRVGQDSSSVAAPSSAAVPSKPAASAASAVANQTSATVRSK